MQNALLIIQIVLSVLMTGAILLQSQGSGLGSTWGGGGESYHTKRGVERVMVYFTIFCIAMFAVLSVLRIILS